MDDWGQRLVKFSPVRGYIYLTIQGYCSRSMAAIYQALTPLDRPWNSLQLWAPPAVNTPALCSMWQSACTQEERGLCRGVSNDPACGLWRLLNRHPLCRTKLSRAGVDEHSTRELCPEGKTYLLSIYVHVSNLSTNGLCCVEFVGGLRAVLSTC